jgi:broad specificity phosphatase PhoE
MKITFLRHGQTNYNIKGICNSKPNSKVRLTALGREQVHAAAKILKEEPFEIIFTSELFRTHQTARIVNMYHHVRMITDRRLNDRSTGCENKAVTLFYDWRRKQKNVWTAKPRGGESYEAMKKRLASFLAELKKMNYHNVLIVTHLPILKVARGYFKKLTNAQMEALKDSQVQNCKIMRFNVSTKTERKR